MMRSLLLVTLVACAAAPPPVTAPCPATVAPAAPPAAALDEAQVKTMSHALFDAFDRADAAALADATGATFGLYEEQRFRDRASMLDALKARADRHAPIHSRTWNDERVLIGPGTVIFIGEAVEHVPPEGDRSGADDDGSNTLVWVRDGARWTAAIWQWEPAGIEAERARWNRWLTEGRGFNHKPNQTLVDAVKGRKPGTALDIATGQGRNSVFLATQGWKVTGVDIADEGLRITREEAARQKVKLETVQSDIDKYDLGKDRWDLVTMIYAGNDAKLVERIKPAVKKGGLFVTEYFAADSEVAKTGAEGWDPKVLEAAFKDGWRILRDDHVDDNADWAGQRKTKLVRFVAQKTGDTVAGGTWQDVGSVRWGVALSERGYQVSYVDHGAVTTLDNGDHPQTVQATPQLAAPLARVPALEQADRAFAADTAKDGADGWARHFDGHGAMWRKDHRVEGADIRASIEKTLAAGALRWEPATSGARGELGFTLGTATFTEAGGAPEKLTYCTIWKHQADGSWRVLFDIGRPAE